MVITGTEFNYYHLLPSLPPEAVVVFAWDVNDKMLEGGRDLI
jgi:hypothetical protein